MTPDHTPRAVPEVLSAEEEARLRTMPVVNRNGSTGDLVDRLLATLDAARGSSEGPGLRTQLDDIEKSLLSVLHPNDPLVKAFRDLRAALTADRSHEGLDVKRLERAIAIAAWGQDFANPEVTMLARILAPKVAAAYTRDAQEPTDG